MDLKKYFATTLLLLFLFCSGLAGEQDSGDSGKNTLPVHCAGLPAGIISFIKTNELELFITPNNPPYIKGNFDGTGAPDYALWLTTYPEGWLEQAAELVVFWNGTANDTTVIDYFSKETILNSDYALAPDSLLACYYNEYIESSEFNHNEAFKYYNIIPPPPYSHEGIYLGITFEGGEEVGDPFSVYENGAYMYHEGKFYYLRYNMAF